jgi:hypothetical protein
MKKLASKKINFLVKKFLWHSGLGNLHDIAVEGYWNHLAVNTKNPLLNPIESYFSQSDEDGIIGRISQRIGINKGKFIELGVGDGLENNTLALCLGGWDGLWFGGQDLNHPKKFELPSNLQFTKVWVDQDSLHQEIIPTIQNYGDIDLLSLDLDGNDFYFASEILESGIRPKIWVQEYNGNIPPQIEWVQEYNPSHSWQEDAYFGASLASYNKLFELHDYKLVACNLLGVNAFFVRSDFSKFFEDTPKTLYETFYPARPIFRKMKQTPSPLAYLKRRR